MNSLCLTLIFITRILIILFVLLTPIFGTNNFIFFHSLMIPFLVFHWIINDNTCALTMLERNIREKLYGIVDDNDCFTCKLIEPVYDFHSNYNDFSTITYCITILMWLIGVSKLLCRYSSGEITSWKELFV
jgi:hypothetical protein